MTRKHFKVVHETLGKWYNKDPKTKMSVTVQLSCGKSHSFNAKDFYEYNAPEIEKDSELIGCNCGDNITFIELESIESIEIRILKGF